MNQATPKSHDTQALDALTGGAFSAATSGERAARLRDWLASNPGVEQMQEVFRELSGRDKGAARLVRERLDEIKRARGQEAMAEDWAARAQALLGQPRLNIADAIAWQRDAAKAGAPLSREPLAGLKVRLSDYIKAIEDLQHRVQVQREGAVLLAQRIEVLSTKSWRDARAATDTLRIDVPDWHAQAQVLVQDASWPSIDMRLPPLLDASRNQLQVVWDAFQGALAQASAADTDLAAPLPPVPVWADELRQARGLPAELPAKASRPKVDPQRRAQAQETVQAVLSKLEQEVAEGHGKASAGAAAALRGALKEHGRFLDDKLEHKAHAALAAAGEMEGWQRWRTDQLRQELVAKAEDLFEKPAPGPVPAPPPAAEEGAPAPVAAPVHARKPRLGGRKMQEQLRALRDQWKQLDQSGAPNHALWKRFDEACNEAYKVVEVWLDKVKSEAAEHRNRRLALIDELKAWAVANPTAAGGDWKGFSRVVHQFESRWREAGHLSEKAFAEMQPQWKEAVQAAQAPLLGIQKQSLDRRHAMIEEAQALGAGSQLRIDAVRALQQRWQAEAQAVPLDRKHEQKLWDAFRKPIDEAFNRKGEERERAAASLSEIDRRVLEASKALEAANASADAQRIRQAMTALESALRGQAQAREAAAQTAPAVSDTADASAPEAAGEASDAGTQAPEASDAAPSKPEPAKPAPRPVIAMRGDDRPGMRKTEPAALGRSGRPGERKPAGPGSRPGERDGRTGYGRQEDRFADRGPRLGDAAFRAQREALEHAQSTLRKLAAQAHGEALAQLMNAWEQRAGDQVPSLTDLGKGVSAGVRSSWAQALGASPAGDASQALLRLEIAAEAPTPAEHLSARRAMQLQLLTRRNDPAPVQTWGQDAAQVLASAHDPAVARRLQNVLKILLRA